MSIKTEQYVVNNYQFAKKAGDRFKMDPLVILAQGSFESAWGTSNLSTKHNNFFGITAGGKPNEFWKGGVYQAQNQYKLKFRTYASPQDSFNDFARLISANYKTAHAAAMDYKKYADKIAHSPYISEKNGDNRNAYMRGLIANYESILAIAKKKIFLSQEDSPSQEQP
ncbi:glucosaminidase domain-containing protein [Flavobacterium sp.]|uniref:glucosaminidase domain-containing protein n=1 Tax=Flavobacterium sp. TaxID=239 RepID=UPI0025EA1686|nr:glucosaminidase domain-containing protein [Flavobacterium sp.]